CYASWMAIAITHPAPSPFPLAGGGRANPDAFLGVERSLTGRRWRSRGQDERTGLAIAQRLGLPEIVGRLLAGRGIGPAAAESFLEPRLRDLLPDPSGF